jgi:nucleoside-diphosphate-sugar epimerase
MRVLVTGGTGFTGAHLVRRLLARGDVVTMLDTQSTAASSELEKASARLVLGSVTDAELVDRTMVGQEVVCHLAAAFQQIQAPDSVYREVNIEGTRNVLSAAERHSVRKVLHCSTAGVHADRRYMPWNEDSPIVPKDIYVRTKWEGEKVCQEFIKRGMNITVVRPTSEYGPGDLRGNRFIFRLVKTGRFLMFGNGHGSVHPIYIDNLIDLFELVLDTPGSEGRVYLAGDEVPCTLNELVALVGRVQGIDVKIIHVPLLGPLWIVAAATEFACKPFGINPPLFRRRVSWFQNNRAYSIDRAKSELGYRPRVPLEEGLRRTAAWYRQEGYI